MSQSQRKRGRPMGSCIDDSKILNDMADLILSSSKLKPTTAIKQLLADPGQSLIHRLRKKWKAQRSDLIAKAETRQRLAREEKKRIAQERVMSSVKKSGYGSRLGSVYGDAISQTIAALNAPNLKYLQEQSRASKLSQDMMAGVESIRSSMSLTTLSSIQNAIESPALKAIRDMETTNRQIREALGLTFRDHF